MKIAEIRERLDEVREDLSPDVVREQMGICGASDVAWLLDTLATVLDKLELDPPQGRMATDDGQAPMERG